MLLAGQREVCKTSPAPGFRTEALQHVSRLQTGDAVDRQQVAAGQVGGRDWLHDHPYVGGLPSVPFVHTAIARDGWRSGYFPETTRSKPRRIAGRPETTRSKPRRIARRSSHLLRQMAEKGRRLSTEFGASFVCKAIVFNSGPALCAKRSTIARYVMEKKCETTIQTTSAKPTPAPTSRTRTTTNKKHHHPHWQPQRQQQLQQQHE